MSNAFDLVKVAAEVIASIGNDLHVGTWGEELLIRFILYEANSVDGIHIVFVRLPIMSVA